MTILTWLARLCGLAVYRDAGMRLADTDERRRSLLAAESDQRWRDGW
jgi:hypothetical protein